MRTSTRDRLVLPILLPIGIVLGVAAVLYLFSRVLLSLTADAATATALIVAFSILVIASIAASRTVIRASTLASMVGAIAGVALLAGGIALVAVGSTGGEAGGGGSAVTIPLVAKNLTFDTTSLTAPADKPFAIAFDNQDPATQHDVQIFDNKDYSGKPVFDGKIITGVAKITYDVQALSAGTYYFHCVVHPTTMKGTLEVKPAPAGGGGTPGGGGATVTVIAQNLQFDTSTIYLPGNAPSTIHFENNDPGVQHNIAIFTDSSMSTRLFTGALVTGPGAADYQIPPLAPGSYYFHCDVHPTMNGKVSVG